MREIKEVRERESKSREEGGGSRAGDDKSREREKE